MTGTARKWLTGLMYALILTGCARKPVFQTIPVDSAVYVRIRNLEKNWSDFSDRDSVRQCAQLQILQEPWFRSILEPFERLKSDFEKNTGIPLNRTSIMMLFGKNVEIAIVPNHPVPDLLVISELGSGSAALKTISRIVESVEKDRVSIYTYMGTGITAIAMETPEFPDIPRVQEVLYCFQQSRIIVATNRHVMEHVLSSRYGSEPSLPDTHEFKQIDRSLGSPDTMVYVKSSRLMQIVSQVSHLYGISFERTKLQVEYWAAGLSLNNDGLDVKTALKPAKDELDLWRKYYVNPDALDQSARWLPDTAIAVSVSGINIPGMIAHQQSMLGRIHSLDGVDLWTGFTQFLQTVTGLDMPGELSRWAGTGMFFSIETISMTTLIPIPGIAFGIHVRDPESAREFTENLKHRIDLQTGMVFPDFVQEQLDQTNVYHYVPVPFSDLQPGYVICHDYLVFGTSRHAVLQSLKAYTGTLPGVTDSPQFAEAFSSSRKNRIAFQSIRPSLIASAGKKLLDVTGLFLVAAGHDPAAYREILDLMDMIPVAVFTLTLQDDLVIYRGWMELP